VQQAWLWSHRCACDNGIHYSPIKISCPMQVRKTKPEPRVCPVCDAVVGISSQSLAVHVKKAHPEQYTEFADTL